MTTAASTPTHDERDRPSFTIVVPTYQRRDTVADAVRAIAAIRYSGPLELVVIIDGSEDGTLEALEAIDCPFPKKVVWQDNAGLARARNRGAQEAGGEILLFLDDDMMSRPNIVEQHAASHLAGADAVLGHIPLDPASPGGLLAEAIGDWADTRAKDLAGGKALTLFDLLGGHLSVRRAAYHAVGGFDESFTAGGSYGNEDLDFGSRLIAGHEIAFNPEAVAYHRYVVSPRHHMRQYFQAGTAAVAFARKHPRVARELFALHGAETRKARFVLRPLARSRWLAGLIGEVALGIAAAYPSLPRLLRPLAKRLFFDARDLVYWSGVLSRGGIPGSGTALVLCYHALADLGDDPILAEYGIAPGNFAQQIDDLAARGFCFISPDEFAALVEGAGRVPRKAVLLTFDDCYHELADELPALLPARGIGAIAFAVSSLTGRTNVWDNTRGMRTLQLLDGEGLRRLQECGVEIGCHSRTHPMLTQLPADALASETEGAAAELAALGLRRPRFFAYPFGELDAASRAAVAQAGYLAGFGLDTRRVSPGSDRLDLPRIEIMASDKGWRFRFKTAFPALAGTFFRSLHRARSLVARLSRPLRAPGSVAGN